MRASTRTDDAPTSIRRWVARLALVALALMGALVAFAPAQPGVAVYLAAAAQARLTYRYDRALHWDALAAAAAPSDPQPVCDGADLYARQQVWGAAQAAYRRCLALAPGDASGWYALGEALAATDAVAGPAGALAAWQRAASLTQGSADRAASGAALAWRRLAGRAEYARQFTTAAADWRRVVALTPPRSSLAAEATLHVGLIALWQGDLATARAAFAATLATNGPSAAWLRQNGLVQAANAPATSATALERLGYDYLAAGLPALALAPLTRAVALAPSLGSAHVFRGWALWTLGLRGVARGEIATGLRLAPRLSFADFAAGEVAATDGSPSRALALFTQGLALDGGNPALWSEAGRMELALDAYVPTAQDMRLAAQFATNPAYSVALLSFYVGYHLGLAAGDATGNALTAALTATTRWPSDEPLWYLLGQVYDQAGQQTYAYYAFLRAQTLDPTDPGPYLWLGRYAENEGDYLTAALDLHTALALRPTGPLAAQAQALLAPLASITA